MTDNKCVYVLWGAYSDNSGSPEFFGVYGTDEQAFEAKDLIDLGQPMLQIHVNEVIWRGKV